jgi:hypothetical protein
VTKKHLLLIAALLIAVITLALGLLAMMPPGPGVTKANFDRIKEGMTRAEVEEIFGGPAFKSFEYSRVDRRFYSSRIWCENNGNESAWIEFFDDESVFRSEWSGSSNETFLDKICRWLHVR